MWDTFKHGSDLWQRIFRDKLEPHEEEYVPFMSSNRLTVDWLMRDSKHALYANYYKIS